MLLRRFHIAHALSESSDANTPRHLRWLMAHRDAYDAMLAWKQNATELARLDKMLQLASHTGWCRLCHAVRP